jgi:hypothetical protein
VRIHRAGAGTTLEGDRCCYYVARCQGTVLRARDAVERIAFDADNLGAPAADAVPDADFAPVDSADTRTWIVARDVIVFPSERIQFTDASLYVGDKRMFSLPYYVAPLSGEHALLNQLLSLSSSGGINLDLPFYYAADSAHAGALHLRHRAANGYGFGAPGWSLGIEEQYRLSADSTGTLAVDDVTESTRSMRLDHELDLGARGRVNMGLNYYRYSPDYPGALTGRAFYSRRLQGADLDVIALGSTVGSLTNWSLDANMRWGGREIGRSGVGYDVTTNMGYGGGQLGYGGGLCLGGGLGVSPPAWDIAKSTSATLDLTQQYTWAQIGGVATTFDARAALRQGLGGLGSMSLSCSYNLSRGGYYSSYGREQITLNAYLSQGTIWNASGYASYSLDQGGLFASGGASYRLPIGERGGELPWRLDLRGSFTRFGTSRAMNSRVAIGRALGRYEALLCWSPSASAGYGSYGYGYGAGKTFWIELAPRGW